MPKKKKGFRLYMKNSFLSEVKQVCRLPRNDVEISSPESFTLRLTRRPTRIMQNS